MLCQNRPDRITTVGEFVSREYEVDHLLRAIRACDAAGIEGIRGFRVLALADRRNENSERNGKKKNGSQYVPCGNKWKQRQYSGIGGQRQRSDPVALQGAGEIARISLIRKDTDLMFVRLSLKSSSGCIDTTTIAGLCPGHDEFVHPPFSQRKENAPNSRYWCVHFCCAEVPYFLTTWARFAIF